MTSRTQHIHGVLLAAGQSQRFAGVKQIAVLAPKEKSHANQDLTLVASACTQVMVAKFDSCQLMLGANADIIRSYVPNNMPIVVAANWHDGMGATIAEAIRSMPAQASHVCIMLADQVNIRAEHYNALIAQAVMTPNTIVAASVEKRLVAPSIFPSQYFAKLARLSSDVGAKHLLRQEQVIDIAIPEASLDIDTPEDLRKWLNSHK